MIYEEIDIEDVKKYDGIKYNTSNHLNPKPIDYFDVQNNINNTNRIHHNGCIYFKPHSFFIEKNFYLEVGFIF